MSTRLPRVAALVIALGIVATVTGCAGDASSSDSPTDQTSPSSIAEQTATQGPAAAATPSGFDPTVARPTGTALPDTWPSTIPNPKALKYQGSYSTGASTTAVWAGVGNVGDVSTSLASAFAANGFKTTDPTPPTTARRVTTTWTKQGVKVTVSIMAQANDVLVEMTAAR